MVAEMRRLAARLVTKKNTGPAVVVHGFGGASRRQGDLDDADKCVLKDKLVTAWRRLNGVEAVGKTRLVQPVEVEVTRAQQKRTYNRNGNQEKFATQALVG
jgi:hypothetical protein